MELNSACSVRTLFYYLEGSRSFRSSSRHCQVTERLSMLVPCVSVHVISSLQNVGRALCEDVRKGDRVSKGNCWKREKLLTVQEWEITQITPPKLRHLRCFHCLRVLHSFSSFLIYCRMHEVPISVLYHRNDFCLASNILSGDLLLGCHWNNDSPSEYSRVSFLNYNCQF